ncbi:MAG TPA: ribonuclease Y, partial [Candidatus Polarisedimenticolaceae bacterium]|nr:ribonuclease Y [Candidatus Polarisedimenticolaceae bacterium]
VVKSRLRANALLKDAETEAENKKKEILVTAQERLLAMQDESDQRERELDERETTLQARAGELDRRASDVGRERSEIERRVGELRRAEAETQRHLAASREKHDEAQRTLERITGLTLEQAKQELIAGIEEETRALAARLTRKIEDEARQTAERRAVNLMLQSSERIDIRDVVESTVSFIELPSDEMKGRIIGREGRNIRALEMATGIDLIVDDTPRSILISSFDPLRREIARVAIDRLVEDGRIHPARIEEVVARVREEVDELIQERGNETVLALGISDLHPRLVHLVGKMRYRTCHGHNLLQHCRETALIAGHMAQELNGRVDVAVRAGLLHEVGRVEQNLNGNPTLYAAELCARFGESPRVVEAIRGLHAEVETKGLEPLLVRVASRMSDARPGARKENLAVFVERLRRLEEIATRFPGIDRAFCVKAGKEIRVIVNAAQVSDEKIHSLSREIARAVERELAFPGQIKVHVIRETRSVRYAL